MKIGTVSGSLELLRGAECLLDRRFLTVTAGGEQLAALDLAGAETGDTVLLATGAAAARYTMESPADAAVIAVLRSSTKKK